tara:strand:- start:27 stop:362 length:336 start_codon:yes stop_codon:yes gene_type:complete
MKLCVLLTVLFASVASAQYKDGISIVQYSAKFVKSNEIDLKPFRSHNTFTLYLANHSQFFSEEKILYLPSIVLYENGEEITRIESGISLKLPEDSHKVLNKHIEKLLEGKF